MPDQKDATSDNQGFVQAGPWEPPPFGLRLATTSTCPVTGSVSGRTSHSSDSEATGAISRSASDQRSSPADDEEGKEDVVVELREDVEDEDSVDVDSEDSALTEDCRED